MANQVRGMWRRAAVAACIGAALAVSACGGGEALSQARRDFDAKLTKEATVADIVAAFDAAAAAEGPDFPGWAAWRLARLGRVEAIEALAPKLDFNLFDDAGENALFAAVRSNRADAARWIYEHVELDIRAKNKEGKTAFDVAPDNAPAGLTALISEARDGPIKALGALEAAIAAWDFPAVKAGLYACSGLFQASGPAQKAVAAALPSKSTDAQFVELAAAKNAAGGGYTALEDLAWTTGFAKLAESKGRAGLLQAARTWRRFLGFYHCPPSPAPASDEEYLRFAFLLLAAYPNGAATARAQERAREMRDEDFDFSPESTLRFFPKGYPDPEYVLASFMFDASAGPDEVVLYLLDQGFPYRLIDRSAERGGEVTELLAKLAEEGRSKDFLVKLAEAGYYANALDVAMDILERGERDEDSAAVIEALLERGLDPDGALSTYLGAQVYPDAEAMEGAPSSYLTPDYEYEGRSLLYLAVANDMPACAKALYERGANSFIPYRGYSIDYDFHKEEEEGYAPPTRTPTLEEDTTPYDYVKKQYGFEGDYAFFQAAEK